MTREIGNILCITPPYPHGNCPPAGAAALLGHLKASGCDDFRFLDLRLLAPEVSSPTFNPVGVFGESYVIDVPDLPLVLRVLKGFDDGCDDTVGGPRDAVFDRYSYVRGIDPATLHAYLVEMDRFLDDVFAPLGDLRVVGFSVWSSNLTTTLMAAARLKRRRRPPYVIAGGPQVTESRAAALLGLQAGLFDAVILGEGEQALLDVYRAHQGGRPVAGLPGVLALDPAGRAVPPPSRPLLPLSSLAAPDFTEMFLPAYSSPTGTFRLPFQFSRGCTDKCSFCSEWVFWERFRPATIDHSVEQLQELSARYGVNRFHFTDSLINGHMKRLRQFAQAVIDCKLAIDWGGFMRADMDDGTARLLKAAGFSYAFIGVESLSDETLDLMNKRRTSADNLRAIQAFLAAGISVSVGVIPGFPGDTRERFLRTVQELTRIADCHRGMFSFNVEPFIVSPSQPLYGRLEEVGLSAYPWDDAVLEIAARYRDLTEQIDCRVEGANQGVERLGQLKLLRMLLNGRRFHPAASVCTPEGELPVYPSSADRIGLDTMVEAAPGAIFRVVPAGDLVSLHAPGIRIDGPARIAPALRFIARTRRFTPRALPDNLTPDAKLVLVRRLIREKLLTVVNPPADAGDSEPPENGRSLARAWRACTAS